MIVQKWEGVSNFVIFTKMVNALFRDPGDDPLNYGRLRISTVQKVYAKIQKRWSTKRAAK